MTTLTINLTSIIMHLKSSFPSLKLHKRLNYNFLCTITNPVSDSTTTVESNDVPKPRKTKAPLKVHQRDLEAFFQTHPKLAPYEKLLPEKVLLTRHYKNPDYFYLICPEIAQKIANKVIQRVPIDQHVSIIESNPGLGLITTALLNKGVPFVRLYEINTEFQSYIKEAFKDVRDRISLFNRDFFTLWRYAFCDNIDQGQRVDELLKGVDKKSWNDVPAIVAVGTLSKHTFLNYLVKSIVLQKELAVYGRLDLFVVTYETVFKTFTATTEDSSSVYTKWTTLYQAFFDMELIDKYPRKYFMPWQMSVKKRGQDVDQDNLYLIRFTMKKEFSLPADHMVPFYCFMLKLYGRGNGRVIPTCEKWVPGCGINLIVPTLVHDNYYENMDIYTYFRDLNPAQLLAIYKELSVHPSYENSPFMDMIEEEWVKMETIATDINDSHKNPT